MKSFDFRKPLLSAMFPLIASALADRSTSQAKAEKEAIALLHARLRADLSRRKLQRLIQESEDILQQFFIRLDQSRFEDWYDPDRSPWPMIYRLLHWATYDVSQRALPYAVTAQGIEECEISREIDPLVRVTNDELIVVIQNRFGELPEREQIAMHRKYPWLSPSYEPSTPLANEFVNRHRAILKLRKWLDG